MIKKLFNVFLISLISLGNFFILPQKSMAAGSDIRINEVAPSEVSDWIELYAAVSGDYSGFIIKERSTVIKTFPTPFNLTAGDFVILHLNQTGTDENSIIGKGENGYWDLYSSDAGLTSTDNVIIIENSLGNKKREN